MRYPGGGKKHGGTARSTEKKQVPEPIVLCSCQKQKRGRDLDFLREHPALFISGAYFPPLAFSTAIARGTIPNNEFPASLFPI